MEKDIAHTKPVGEHEVSSVASRYSIAANRRRAPATSTTEDVDGWILTYIDTITLLLTLFVMLLAYSSQNQHSFTELQGSLKGVVQRPDAEAKVSGREAMEERLTQFSSRLQAMQLGKDISYQFEEGRLVLQFGERILFPSGEATITRSGLGVMEQLLPVLEGTRSTVVVEGHTDNVPIANAVYASNWELSSARAATVVRYLVEHGVEPDRVSAVGFADTRPIGDNTTDAGRAKNRRVTFSVSYTD